VTASVARARENIRSVREQVSQELWEAVNDLHLMLAGRDLIAELEDQPYELFRALRRASMTIYGAASETMPRDEGWRFMALGRLLERAEMTCRLIDVRYVQLEALSGPSRRLARAGAEVAHGSDRSDFHDWIAVLKSASAFEAYRRRYRASMDPADVVEFLLLEPDLPRSVRYSLRSARFQLDALGGGRPSRAARQLGRISAALEFRDVSELFDVGLSAFLEDVQLQIAEVAEAVAAEFFHHEPAGSLHAIATG
ncbi:MAG: alpha-E domain-containing protein, partial [Nitriliruptoraceae bacterium]